MYQQMTLSPKLGMVKISTLWHFRLPLLIHVTGGPCGWVAQWSECSHRVQEVLGSSPGGPCAFSSPVTSGGSVWVRAGAASSKGTVSSVPSRFRDESN